MNEFRKGQIVHVAGRFGPSRATVISVGPKWLTVKVAHQTGKGRVVSYQRRRYPADTDKVFPNYPDAREGSRALVLKQIRVHLRVASESVTSAWRALEMLEGNA